MKSCPLNMSWFLLFYILATSNITPVKDMSYDKCILYEN